MVLNISGLIDAQSALYTELLKYFAEVHYEVLPQSFGTENMLEQFPEHYFFTDIENVVMRIIGGEMGGRRINPPSKNALHASHYRYC